MKNLFWLICCGLFPFFLFAQHVDTTEAHAWWEKAIVFDSLEQYDSSANAYKNAISLFFESGKQNNLSTLYERGVVSGKLFINRLEENGNLNRALISADSIRRLSMDVLGEEHYLTANLFRTQGIIYSKMRRLDSAKVFFLQAQDLLLRNFNEDDLKLAPIYVSLGVNSNELRDNKTAWKMYQKALFIFQSNPSTNELAIANCYNNMAVIRKDEGKFAEAESLYKKALEIYNRAAKPSREDVITTRRNIAKLLRLSGQYDKALSSYEKILLDAHSYWDSDDYRIAEILEGMSLTLNELGRVKDAFNYLNKVREINVRHFGEVHSKVAANYHNLAMSCILLKDFFKAEAYANQANRIFQKLNPSSSINIGLSYHNRGAVFAELGEYEKAKNFFEKALKIERRILGEEHPIVMGSYMNLGALQIRLKNYNEALLYLRKSLELQTNYDKSPEKDIANTYSQIGLVLTELQRKEEALNYQKKALRIRQKIFKSSHPEIAQSFFNIAQIFQDKENTDSARVYYSKAKEILKYVYKGMPHQDLIELHKKLGEFEQAIGNQEVALKEYETAIETMNLKVQTYNNPSSKLFLKQTFVDLLGKATCLAIEMGLYEKGFKYAENSKSTLLKQHIQEKQGLHMSGVPERILELEGSLQVQIKSIRQNLIEEELIRDQPDSLQTAVYEDNLFKAEQSLDSLIRAIEKNYPAYYDLKYNLSTVSPPQIQSKLLPEQALVEFVVVDCAAYLFLITKNNFLVRVLPDFDPDLVPLFREAILNMASLDSMDNADKVYRKYGFELYKQLLAPVEKNLKEIEHILIIPDGILGYVPFDALLTESMHPDTIKSYKNYPYLLKRFNISYAYSADSWIYQLDHPVSKASSNLLAIGPHFPTTSVAQYERGALSPLRFNIPEAKEISQSLNGIALIGRDATRENFFQEIGDHKIIHFSTHGIVNDVYPELSALLFWGPNDSLTLTGEVLDSVSGFSLSEIYGYAFNAELVVLSACETGLGKLYRGEGIASLSRAFSFAGVPSQVATLWKVNDKSTKDVMVRFYDYLKQGWEKDAALREAKLDYMKNNKENLAPYFWAGAIPIGNMRAVSLDNFYTPTWILVLLGCLLAAGVSFLVLKRRK